MTNIILWGNEALVEELASVFKLCWNECYNILGYINRQELQADGALLQKNGGIASLNATQAFTHVIEGASAGIYLGGVSREEKSVVKKNILPFLSMAEFELELPQIEHAENCFFEKKMVNDHIMYILKDMFVLPNSFFTKCVVFTNDGKMINEYIDGEISDIYPLFRLPQSIDDERIVWIKELYIFDNGQQGSELFQILSQLYILQQQGYEGDFMLFAYPMHRELFALLEIENTIHWINQESDNVFYKVDNLYCLHSEAKKDYVNNEFVKKKIEDVLSKHHFKRANGAYPKRIYFKDSKKSKVILNEAILHKYGVTILSINTMSLEKILNYTHHADLVIINSNNAESCIISLHSNATMIELFPAGQVQQKNADYLIEQHIQYYMLVGKVLDLEKEAPCYMIADNYLEKVLYTASI